jgi:hypothetical protein
MSRGSDGDRDGHRNSYLHSERNIDCHGDRNEHADRYRDRHRNANAYGHCHAERHTDGRSLRERARTHAPSDHRPDYG